MHILFKLFVTPLVRMVGIVTWLYHSVVVFQMCLVFNKEGFKDVPIPMVAQTLVNHNAFLLKIFVVGSHIHIARRPSLKNFSEGKEKNSSHHYIVHSEL